MFQTDQHIITSCGGFAIESDILVFDEYILQHARVLNPRVCFVPTASRDNDNYSRPFYHAFTYVGGGNTRIMLLLWRE